MIILSIVGKYKQAAEQRHRVCFPLFLLPRVLQVRLPEKQQSPVLSHSPDDKHCRKLRYSNNLNLHRYNHFPISFFKNYQHPNKKNPKPGCSHQRGTIPVLNYYPSDCSSPSSMLLPSPFILNKKLTADQKFGRIVSEVFLQEKKKINCEEK